MKTDNSDPNAWRSAGEDTLRVVALVGAFFLDAERTVQEFGMLSFLLGFACLLMHVFMNREQNDGRLKARRYPSEDDL